jgi:hypothetical protein
MKRANYLLVGLLIKSTLLFGQELYFKTSAGLNIAAGTQQMPEYFAFRRSIPFPGWETPRYNISVNNFSIATGVNFQGAAGYSLNDFISIELKFLTFGNIRKEFEASPEIENAPNGKTEWNLRYYNLLPTFLFGHSINRSSVHVFVYSGFGSGKLSIQASENHDFCEYELKRTSIFSWGYGLEYSYSVSKNFSLVTSLGINNSYYKPDKAKLVSSSFPMEYLSTIRKEIVYVNEITSLELGYNGITDPNSPEIRLEETLKLNSICWGIGIKYTLNK